MFNLRSNTLTGLMHGPTSPASRGLAHILSTVFLGANQSLKVAAEVIEKEIGKYPKVPKVLKPLNPAPDGYNNRSFLVRLRRFGLRESHPRILPRESPPDPPRPESPYRAGGTGNFSPSGVYEKEKNNWIGPALLWLVTAS